MDTKITSFIFFIGLLLPLSLSACTESTTTSTQSEALLQAQRCFERKDRDYSEVLTCYRAAQEKQSLQYVKKSSTRLNGIEKRSYELTSQSWKAGGSVTPEQWQHNVDIYVPDDALPTRALLIVNNGINIGDGKNPPKDPTDYPDQMLRSVAQKTRTITISVSNVPNQYLTYQHADVPKKEDDSVAYSWKLFLDAPDKQVFAPLHIPMMAAVVKTMDLAEQELKEAGIHRFIVAGASKRAWATWHTALSDARVDAIVPFVIDILNTKKILKHEYRSFGKGWPMSFKSYFNEGITERLDTTEFEQLMQIEDPLQYLDSAYANRLAIPKYIVNASGDDFFTPDNAQFYFDQLPGIKMLRVAPNSSHYGINQFAEDALVPFVNRFQQSTAFPVLTTKASIGNNKTSVQITFSEQPVEIRQWIATNPVARDFRYSCGIRYEASELTFTGKNEVSAVIDQPIAGWTASFIEARFHDGLVMTSPVYVAPENIYRDQPEPSTNPICQIMRRQPNEE